MASEDKLVRLLASISGNRRSDASVLPDTYAGSIRWLLPTQTNDGLAQGGVGLPAGTTNPLGPNPPSSDSGQVLTENLNSLTRQVLVLIQTTSRQTDTLERNTKAMVENTMSHIASRASDVAKATQRFLGPAGAGLLASPLVSGLLRLFRNDKIEPGPDPVTYQAPPSVNVFSGLTSENPDELTAVSYGQLGQPRVVSSLPKPAAPPVTVNVNAIDTRSFLDHADEIAEAMRRAILNSHALSDVIHDV